MITEEIIIKEIIENFKSMYGFELREVKRKIANYKQYKYDIEVLKDHKTVAIIEAKMRKGTSHPTTDALLASMFKSAFERKNKFDSSIDIFILFYINDDSLKIENWESFKNNVLSNLNSLLSEKVDFKPVYINISENLKNRIDTLDEQLNNLIM